MTWKINDTQEFTLAEISIAMESAGRGVDFSRIALKIPGYKYAVDIGSWCYVHRRPASKNTQSELVAKREVLKKSYRKAREEVVKGFVDHVLGRLELGLSDKTIWDLVGKFPRFVSWCDEFDESGLDGRREYISALSAYSEHLLHRVRSGSLKINPASQMQDILKAVALSAYGEAVREDLKNIRRIRATSRSVNKTVPPDDRSAELAISVYLDVFRQLSVFVINFEPFPKLITVDEKPFWFFPASIPFAGPSNIHKKPNLLRRYRCYDYENGRLRSSDEANGLRPYWGKANAKNAEITARKNLRLANESRFHKRRIDAATFSSQAFMMLFSAATGMNLSQIVGLNYFSESHVERDKPGFKGVKARAGGKEVVFYLSSSFYRFYLRYLELRSWMLKSVECSEDQHPLFFNIRNGLIEPIAQDFSYNFNRRINICFDIDINITTRKWRSYKADWLLSNVSLKETAATLQNSEQTILKSYAEGVESKSSKEIARFFKGLRKSLESEPSSGCEVIPIGACVGESPDKESDGPVEPDCRVMEGCLFCENYRVNADKTDYLKLMSFRYMVEISRPLASNQSHFEKTSGRVKARIDELLKYIEASKGVDQEQANLIRESVYKREELSPYWSWKLDLLYSLGLEI